MKHVLLIISLWIFAFWGLFAVSLTDVLHSVSGESSDCFFPLVPLQCTNVTWRPTSRTTPAAMWGTCWWRCCRYDFVTPPPWSGNAQRELRQNDSGWKSRIWTEATQAERENVQLVPLQWRDCWARRHFGHIPHDCQALPPSVFLPTRRERKTLCDSCFTASPVLADDCYPGKCLGLFSSFFCLTTPSPQTQPFSPQIFSLVTRHLHNPSALTSRLLLVSLFPCGACRRRGTRATRWTRIWPSRTPRPCSR